MSLPNKRKDAAVSQQQIEQHFGPVCEWHVVDHFDTIDDAAKCVEDLHRNGHHARHSMIDGLNIVARRSDDTLL